MRQLIKRHPGKTLHSIGVLIGGFYITCNIVSTSWDQQIWEKFKVETYEKSSNSQIKIKSLNEIFNN